MNPTRDTYRRGIRALNASLVTSSVDGGGAIPDPARTPSSAPARYHDSISMTTTAIAPGSASANRVRTTRFLARTDGSASMSATITYASPRRAKPRRSRSTAVRRRQAYGTSRTAS